MHRTITAMHRSTDAHHGEWTEARLDRLTRGMYPLIFGCAPAPAPAADNVITLATRRPAPCPD
jgi:hypothetical protein